MRDHRKFILALCWMGAAGLAAQTTPELKEILVRLDRLEKENQNLREEVRELRQQVAASTQARTEEKVAVLERRVDEQAQTKVESSQKLPVRLTGMALMNASVNGNYSGGVDNPTTATLNVGRRTASATLEQSILGLEFNSPSALWGGKVHGNVYADFYASTSNFTDLVRLRTASIEIDWNKRGLMVGQEKPIFAPRNPTSLAQVWIPALTGAGNLWRWQPQIRYQERVRLGKATQLLAQVGVIQTNEPGGRVPTAYASTLEPRRPALEGRFELSHRFEGERRVEIAPGFHASTTHVAATAVPSNLFSLDWFAIPVSKIEFSGAFYSGQNVAHLGALGQGFTILGPQSAIPVHSRGGWAQVTWLTSNRVSFNLFAGQHDDRDRDLRAGNIGKNLAGGANFMYRLATNVILSLEALQVRTIYIGSGIRLNNHYDLAVAYQF